MRDSSDILLWSETEQKIKRIARPERAHHKKTEMAEHNELGKIGEEKAVEYLISKGFTILNKNWRFQKAEIDIIAQKENLLIAAEVKTRSSLEFGNPQDFVNPKKIRLLVQAFDQYIISKDLDVNARFDIIAVLVRGSEFKIEHLEDAFLYF